MYRYEVTASVKSDIEGVVGRPMFYDDGGKYYIDDPKHTIAVQYFDATAEQVVSKTLDQICQDLYTEDFADKSTQSVYDTKDTVNVSSSPPFSDKTLADGRKLFRRVHGVKQTLSGDTDFILTIPYAQCKINGLEVVWAPAGLQVDLKVLDSTTGTYSTIPNYELNQFGFATGIAKDFYAETSNYDADLYLNMQVKCTIINPDSLTDTICVNFILHQVV